MYILWQGEKRPIFQSEISYMHSSKIGNKSAILI